MNHGSLFSGIGGFDLAAEWMGWNNVFHCEIEPFGQKVLKYYWPKAKLYEDITQTDFTIHRGHIDIISGGFPCQPYSQAGKRLGKNDDRHLWPRMLEVIRDVQPRWVVGENVYGLTNWNGGMVFEEVCADLEAAGYEVQPYILPACGVNAPHRRNRVWFIANSTSRGSGELRNERKKAGAQSSDVLLGGKCGISGKERSATETSDTRLQGGKDNRSVRGCGSEWNEQSAGCFRTTWENFPTQPPIRSGDDGLSSELHGITFPKWRNESIKAYGNAIVPQVVYQIFKAIKQYENRTSNY